MEDIKKTTIQISEATRGNLRLVEADLLKFDPTYRPSADDAVNFLLNYYKQNKTRRQAEKKEAVK